MRPHTPRWWTVPPRPRRTRARTWTTALALTCAGLALQLPAAPADAPHAGESWQQRKVTHFVVNYVGDAEEAQSVADEAEAAYQRLHDDLGFRKVDDFWLWDRRVRIFIYPTREKYIAATRSPAWSGGKARGDTREIDTYRRSGGFLTTILPHEITHLMFHDFMGFETEAPQWLHEGLAQWQDHAGRKSFHMTSRVLVLNGLAIPLGILIRMDVRTVTQTGIAVAYYTEAASVVGFLLETRGADEFRELCRHLKEGKDLDAALRFTYKEKMANIGELEKVWKQYLETVQ